MEPQRSGGVKFWTMIVLFTVLGSATLGAYLMAAPANVNRFYPGGLSLASGGEGFSIGADTVLSRSAANVWSLGAGDSLIGATWVNSTNVSASSLYIEGDSETSGSSYSTPAKTTPNLSLGYNPTNLYDLIGTFETAWTGGILDSTYHTQGNYSVKLTSVNFVANSTSKGTLGLDLSGKDIMFDVYVSNDSAVSTIQVYFATSGAYSPAAQREYAIRVISGWNTISLNQGDFNADGGFVTANWATINNIMFNIKAKVGSTVTIYVDNLRTVTQKKLGGRVSFNFDDGPAYIYNQYTPDLDKYGYRANTFIVPDWVGDGGFMTLAQIQELDKKGWDVCSHSYTHLGWNPQCQGSTAPYSTSAELEYELSESQKYLVQNGITRGSRFFAAPGFKMNSTALTFAEKYYLGVRYLGNNISALPSPPNYLKDYYNATPTLAECETAVDEAVAHNGWVVFHFYTYNDWFDDLLTYIYTANVDVVTYSDVFDGHLTDYNARATASLVDGLDISPSNITSASYLAMTDSRYASSKFVPYNTKIADIHVGDTSSHYLNMAALGLPTNSVCLILGCQRVNGTGALYTYPNDGANSRAIGLAGSYDTMYAVPASGAHAGEFRYAQATAWEDFDLYCFGYWIPSP